MNIISNLLAVVVTIVLMVITLKKWLPLRKHALEFEGRFAKLGTWGGPEAAYMSAQKFRVANLFRNIFWMVSGTLITEILTYPTNLWIVLLIGMSLMAVLTVLRMILMSDNGNPLRYFDV